MKAQGNRGDINIPGKSIPQWYAYRLFVKLMRKVTGDTVSLSTTIPRCFCPAASTGAYLKRKQRAKLLIRSIPSLSGNESWKERRYTMASVVAWELHGPGISKEALGHQNVGKRHALMSKADRRSRPVFGRMHTRPLERAHRRPVSQATEEVDINGRVVPSGQIDNCRVSPWRLSETLEENFAARHPAAPRCQIRRETNNNSNATGKRRSVSNR